MIISTGLMTSKRRVKRLSIIKIIDFFCNPNVKKWKKKDFYNIFKWLKMVISYNVFRISIFIIQRTFVYYWCRIMSTGNYLQSFMFTNSYIWTNPKNEICHEQASSLSSHLLIGLYIRYSSLLPVCKWFRNLETYGYLTFLYNPIKARWQSIFVNYSFKDTFVDKLFLKTNPLGYITRYKYYNHKTYDE